MHQRWPRPHGPKTDLGTIILHWLLAGALLGAIVTGLSIASISPEHEWIAPPDGIPLRSGIWAGHFCSALMLILVAIVYPMYMRRAALVPRIRLDVLRLRGLAHRRYRWATINVVHNWICYLTVLTQILTGGMLYFVREDVVIVGMHRLATWIIVALVPVHVLAHFAFGGYPQLLRLFRQSAQLAPPQRHFDPFQDRDEQ